ncbi:hypothetical protein BX600DRAFT_550483 [Xylariales sp. PMI_506]|nr:hypothetical protein BX600DRAFT_550483 [Xylariales sp. PMI_506]
MDGFHFACTCCDSRDVESLRDFCTWSFELTRIQISILQHLSSVTMSNPPILDSNIPAKDLVQGSDQAQRMGITLIESIRAMDGVVREVRAAKIAEPAGERASVTQILRPMMEYPDGSTLGEQLGAVVSGAAAVLEVVYRDALATHTKQRIELTRALGFFVTAQATGAGADDDDLDPLAVGLAKDIEDLTASLEKCELKVVAEKSIVDALTALQDNMRKAQGSIQFLEELEMAPSP